VSGELMLEATDVSLLIIERRECTDIVVGVPHHAPAGVEHLHCPEHRESDENVGFLGRYLAEKLSCCSIIACNYTVDVNKYFRTDYCMQIASWNPKVLVEIHGHGSGKAKSDIEISSGSTNNDRSEALARALNTKLSGIAMLDSFSICGTYDKLDLAAKNTVTINDGRWIPYHIELPKEIRKPSDANTGKPPETGYAFCDALAEALIEIHRKDI
jgi:hypothetical protein